MSRSPPSRRPAHPFLALPTRLLYFDFDSIDAAQTGRHTMGFEDITKKAQDFLGDDKVKDALKSEQAEDISDKLLGGVADAANKVTGGKFEDQIEGALASADEKIGDE